MRKRGSAIFVLAGLILALGRDVHAEDEALQLKERRDTLFSSYVQFRKNLPDGEPKKVPNTATDCDVWNSLPESAKGVFLTITHRLQIAKVRTGESLLQHMDGLYAIRGSNGTHCNGENFNRLFLSMDEGGWHALVDARAQVDDDQSGEPDPIIRDFGFVDIPVPPWERRWRKSGDIKKHAPFTATGKQGVESNMGGPRAQVHFFNCPQELNPSCPIILLGKKRGSDLKEVTDTLLLEIDQDYNLKHNSATDCPYKINPLNPFSMKETGRARYTRNYDTPAPAGSPPVDFGWAPTCETPGGGGGGGCESCSDCSFMLQPGCFMGDLPCCSI